MTLAQMLALVEQHRQAGRLDRAESLCRQVLQANPKQPDTLHLLGVIAHQSGRTVEAIVLLRCALAANDTIAIFHSNLCEMLRLTGQLEAALEAGRKAVALASASAFAQNNLGIACFELGNHDEAVACYRRALALNTGLAETHSNLGNALRAKGELAAAVEAHRHSIALKPDYADGHNNLGTALRELRRFAEAEAHYRQSLALKPQHPAILNNLALVLLSRQQLDDALALLSRSAELDPNNAQTFVLLASLLSKRKENDRAKAAGERALALQPDHAEALNVMGCVAFDEGRTEEAIGYHRKALAAEPKLAHAHNNLGNALKELGRLEAAGAAYAAALAIDPELASAHLSRADLHTFKPHDPDLAAMERLAASAENLGEEEQSSLQLALGKAYGDMGQHQRSFRHLLQGNAMRRRRIDYDEPAMLQLFDRIQAVFTAELLNSRRGSGDPSMLPVLIVGMPRSGTTLVEQILASHPRLFGAGELYDLRDIIAAHCDLAAVPAPYPECVPAMPGEILQRIGTAYATGLQRRAPQAMRVTDKMPANFFHVGLVRLALPNAHIIHVRRDPIDTCFSCFGRSFRDEQPFCYDLGELGRYYRKYEALMAHWRGVLPARAMIEVQYEELVADLEPQARRIIAYCGLDWDDRCLAFHATPRPVRTASAVQVRQPIYQSAIGRWRP